MKLHLSCTNPPNWCFPHFNMHVHFASSWKASFLSLRPCGGSITYLLMSWRHKKPGHQQKRYSHGYPRRFWFSSVIINLVQYCEFGHAVIHLFCQSMFHLQIFFSAFRLFSSSFFSPVVVSFSISNPIWAALSMSSTIALLSASQSDRLYNCRFHNFTGWHAISYQLINEHKHPKWLQNNAALFKSLWEIRKFFNMNWISPMSPYIYVSLQHK